jgi:hypothetical protein
VNSGGWESPNVSFVRTNDSKSAECFVNVGGLDVVFGVNYLL